MPPLTFAHPDWLWLLLIVPVLILGKMWADRSARAAVDSFVARRLRDLLAPGLRDGRLWLLFPLQIIALICLILTICRPQWGEEKRELKETGRNILIAIDTSRSMLATDVTPDRLTRSKLASQDLLATLGGDRVGLIAFAGQAYLQAPLTTDHEAVAEAIQSLDTTSVPAGGSDLSKALRLAIETVEKSPARNHGLIIFSDGGDEKAGVAAAAKLAAEKKILVMAVGVGSEAGSLIPEPDPSRPGDFVRDREGNVVQTKLDGSILQQIASATGGRYTRLGAQPVTKALVGDILAALDRQQDTSKEERKPIERFRWPLGAGILLLMIALLIRPASRQPRLAPAAVALLVLGGTFAPSNSFAASTPVDARNAYTSGLYEKARDAYARLLGDKPPSSVGRELHYGLGAASHQLQDYDRAVDSFSEALQSTDTALQNRAHQGIAHTLYDQGDRALAKQPQFTIRAWTDAVRHFDSALKIREDNKARENREFVKQRLDELKQKLEEQKQQKKQGGKQQGQQGDGKKGGEESDSQGKQGKKGQQGQEDGKQSKEGENGEEEGDKGQEGKGEEEGKKGEGQQLPEGQIAAGQGGEKPDEEEGEQAEMSEGERSEMTGFSRNEARAFLRTYADDQKSAQLRQRRREPVNGKDW